MDDEKRRQLVNRLYQLAKLEDLADAGIKNLYQLAKDAYVGLNGKLRIDGGSLVRLSSIQPVTELGILPLAVSGLSEPADPFARGFSTFEWSVEFRGRAMLRFRTEIGFRPSPEHVIARCEVKDGTDELPRIFHLVRQDDGADWVIVRQDMTPSIPLTVEYLLDLLRNEVERQLKKFGRAVQ